MAEYIGDLSIDGSEGPWHAIHGGDDLVRCADCRHWATDMRHTGGCVGKAGKPDPDGYCAWAERREGA